MTAGRRGVRSYCDGVAAGHAPSGWRENTASAATRSRPWSDLWQARELVAFFALRDLRVRYRQAVLGVIWVLLQPVVTVAVFTVVFGRLADIDSQGIPYPLFALTGMVLWTYFASATARASDVLVDNASLVTKVRFPRVAAPAGAVLPSAVDMAVTFVLVVLLMAHYRVPLRWSVLTLPAWLALLVATTFGMALWLSALNVRYRDVRHVVAPALQVWFFLTPVVYPSSLLGTGQELVYALNPVAGVVAGSRWAVLGAPWPGWPQLLVSVGAASLVLAGGMRYFHRAERSFADVI